MSTQVDIVNRALLSVGQRAQVSSINPSDGSAPADAAAVLFTPTFQALARTAPWNCLRKQATLSVLAAAAGTPENPNGTTLPIPPVPWQYEYAYPSDCLFFRFIVPAFPVTQGAIPQTTYNNAAPTCAPAGGQIPFAVGLSADASGNPFNVVLTNQSQAQAVYTADQQNPVVWDSLFQSGMVAALAAQFVPALSLNMPLMQMAKANAERIIQQARVSDGNEGVTVMDHVPDWMRARSGGSGWAYGNAACYGGMGWGGWPGMGW